MEIHRKKVIDAPIERVWTIVKDHYGDIDLWASAVDQSDLKVKGDEVGVGTARVCATGFGDLEETVVGLDEGSHSLTFETAGGPKFLTSARSTFQLTAVAVERTELTIRAELHFKPIMALAAPFLRLKFAKGLDLLNGDLKEYAERREAPERKSRRIATLKARRQGRQDAAPA